MDAEIQKKLRAPFPAEAVGKLPRVWCGKCREAVKNCRHSCDEHQRSKCRECGNNMTTAHLHLDYVGHAAVTDRLLTVDPEWTWEPLAFDDAGLPALDRNGGLWVRLTVAGVTRLGYGHADGKTGADAVKEAIGDAIRNSAMRFGVALDLWHKDGTLPQDDDPAPVGHGEEPRKGHQPQQAPPDVDPANQARADLVVICAENNWDTKVIAARYRTQFKEELRSATDGRQIREFTQGLFAVSDVELKALAANGAAQ